MTSLAALADRCQITLNDAGAGTWPQATVESWVLDGIRDYSQFFPRTLTDTTAIAEDDAGHEFDLPADFLQVLLVEFPVGEDPPVYLLRRARTHEAFYDYEGYYDIELTEGYEIQGDNTGVSGKIYLSEEPENGESFTITYLAHHTVSFAVTALPITVRVDHESIIILYVIWQAMKERAATHLQDPDTTSDILQKTVNAATQAEQEYIRALKRAEEHRGRGGYTGPWRSDVYDPIY